METTILSRRQRSFSDFSEKISVFEKPPVNLAFKLRTLKVSKRDRFEVQVSTSREEFKRKLTSNEERQGKNRVKKKLKEKEFGFEEQASYRL